MNKKFTKLMAALALLVFMMPSLAGWGQKGNDDYSIVMKDSGGTGESTSISTVVNTSIAEGNTYVQSISSVTAVYFAATGNGWKLGSGNAAGTFTLGLSSTAQALTVSKVVVKAKNYSTDVTTLTVTLTKSDNSTVDKSFSSLGSDFTDYEFELSSATTIKSIKVNTNGSKKRAYVHNIDVITYDSGSSSTFTVTYNKNGGNEVTGIVPTDGNTYDATNNSVTVAGNTGNLEKPGNNWSGWCLNDGGTGTVYGPDYTTTYTISSNTTFYAKWTPRTHNVAMPAADTYGSYAASATSNVPYGTTVTLTYTPATGYESYSPEWSVNGTTISGNTFTMPDTDVTVGVSVKLYYKDQIDFAFAATNSGSYTDWSNQTGTSGAVYAGRTAGSSSQNYIQLNYNTSSTAGAYHSGIITTGSGGKVKKVVATWATNGGTMPDTRVLKVYGSNTAYSATADLYDSEAQGTQLGSIVKGTGTTLIIDGDYEYVGLITDGAAYFTKIEVYWEPSTDPSVTVAETEIGVDAEGEQSTIGVTYENFGTGMMSDVVFYTKDGETYTAVASADLATVYPWITASINNSNNVNYLVEENEATTSRSAYIRVYAIDDDENEAYSDYITITQAAAPQQYTLTVSLGNNVNAIFVFDDPNGSPLIEDGAEGSVSVLGGTSIEVSPDVADGYLLQSLMVGGTDVTSQLDEFGAYTFTMTGDVTISATAEEAPTPTGDKYVKVTDLTDLTGGQYLIVYEEGGFAFDGSLTTLDAISNTISVTIINNEIAVTSATAASEFTIAAITEGYSIQSASGYYIGQTSDANGMKTSETEEYFNTISIDGDGNADIMASGGAYLRYNASSGQERFRYFKSSTYTGQKAIQLYKKVESTPATETYELTIIGHGDNTTQGWYMIASPVSTTPNQVTNMLTDETAVPYSYDLYRFNQTAESEWENYHQHTSDFNIIPGQGYLYANKNTVELTFTGQPYNGNGVVYLTYSTDNPVENMRGWNLVGNPFGTPATVNMSYYKMNSNYDGFTAVDINQSEPVPVCTGILVQATTSGQAIKFTPQQAQGQAGESMGGLQMTVAQQVTNRGTSAILDNAIVSFNEGSQLEKFYFGNPSANFYIPQGNKEYAIVSAEAQGEMPVNFRANENGSYTLTVNPENVEMNYLHLIDNMTGADVDLLATPSYSFNAKTTDYESRFKLVFAAANQNSEEGNDNFAFFSNGNLIVNNSGEATLQVIDITGRIVSSQRISGSCSTQINAATGVYMLRLINGNDVKVQKMVVR